MTISKLTKAGLITGLALLLFFGAYYLHSVIVHIDTQLATAQAHEDQLMKDNTKLMTDFAALQKVNAQEVAKREELEKQNDTLVSKLAARDKQTQTRVAKVTAKDRSAFDVATDLQSAYQLPSAPAVSPDMHQLYVTVAQAQMMTAAKIEHDAMQQKIADMQTMLDLQKQETQSVQAQLGATQKQLAATQTQLANTTAVMNQYKHVAKKSKPKQVLDVAVKIGLFVGGAFLGHVL